MSFVYKDCWFEWRDYEVDYATLNLLSVNGSVLEIPSFYDGRPVTGINICDQHAILCIEDSFEYFKPICYEFKFYYIEEIHIPKSMESIAVNRLLFPNLKRVFVEEGNTHYKVVDNSLLEYKSIKAPNSLQQIYEVHLLAYYGDSKEFVIPKEVTHLAPYAFSFTDLCSIIASSGLKVDSIRPFMYSKWLDNFDSAVVFGRKVLAFKKEIDEFVVSDNQSICSSTFKYEMPKKVVLDYKIINSDLYSLYSYGFKCVELRDSRILLEGVEEIIRKSSYIIVSPENENYCSIDGVVFSKDCKELILYPTFRECEEYRVPEGVVKISDAAFYRNNLCKAIHLPTTLRYFCLKEGEMLNFDEIVFPELNPDFRFDNLKLSSVLRMKLPASISVLPTNSIIMENAVIDATETQSFMYRSVVCRELYIGEKLRFVSKGAFSGVEVLYALEYKIFNFAEALIHSSYEMMLHDAPFQCVIVYRQDDNLLKLAIPSVPERFCTDTFRSFWSLDGINLDKYIKSLLELEENMFVDTKYKSLDYFIKNNLVACKALSTSVIHDLISQLLAKKQFESISLLCSTGAVSSVVARSLLKEDLPTEFIPTVMGVLEGNVEPYDLNL